MKDGRHFLPPRQSIVYAHTRRMLDATATNYSSFAMEVAERYLGMTAADVRQVKLRTGEGTDLIRAMENNAQIIRRYMDGTVKTLPADLEDAWVLSLPEPYRTDCERDLARRRGMLAVAMPGAPGLEVASVAKLVSEYGNLLNALAPTLADGRFGPDDLPHKRQVDIAGDHVIAAVIGLRNELDRAVHGGTVAG
ncbi:hypothetical protein ERT44_05265 [Stenotrophomonas sp. MA5]|nr:hypothetical protein ERT44_05265 [Stenotrophomonas sp. MA5]